MIRAKGNLQKASTAGATIVVGRRSMQWPTLRHIFAAPTMRWMTTVPHCALSHGDARATSYHTQRQRSPPHWIRWKHAGRMGHKLDKLEELAHRPEREAAQERRRKNKDRKVAKKQKKDGGDNEHEVASATQVQNLENIEDDDQDGDFLVDDEDDDSNQNVGEDQEASLPNPDEVKERMMTILNKFQESLKSIRGADPTPEMFDDVQVLAYGSMTPLKAVGQVVIASPTLAQITCFDPAVAKDVQTAVQLALELNPQVDEGGMVRVPLPRASMEVRKQTAKQLQKKAEACKQRLRQIRRKAMDVVKKGKDGKLAGISKDDAFANGKEIESVTETAMDELNTIVDAKMESIMAV